MMEEKITGLTEKLIFAGIKDAVKANLLVRSIWCAALAHSIDQMKNDYVESTQPLIDIMESSR